MGEKPPDISDEFLEAALNELEFGSVAAAAAASAPQFSSSGNSGATTGGGNQFFAWTNDEDKILENSIAEFGLDSPDLYEKISARLPGKTIEQIKQHFTGDATGLIKLPIYEVSRPKSSQDKRRKRNTQGASSSSAASQQYKRGLWTVEEHRQFLMGIQQYGKGDWKSISMYFVQTRTPSQVASHAQKYFNRPASTTPHETRRHSIHDTRLVDGSIVELPTRLSSQGGDDKTKF